MQSLPSLPTRRRTRHSSLSIKSGILSKNYDVVHTRFSQHHAFEQARYSTWNFAVSMRYHTCWLNAKCEGVNASDPRESGMDADAHQHAPPNLFRVGDHM